MLAVVIFLFDSLREKKSIPLISQVSPVLKILAAHRLKITALEIYELDGILMLFDVLKTALFSWNIPSDTGPYRGLHLCLGLLTWLCLTCHHNLQGQPTDILQAYIIIFHISVMTVYLSIYSFPLSSNSLHKF